MNKLLHLDRPFSDTRALVSFMNDQWDSPARNGSQLCKKITAIALAALAFTPTLLTDLILFAVGRIYRRIYSHPAPLSGADRIPDAAAVGRIYRRIYSHPAPLSGADRIPDAALVQRLLKPPYDLLSSYDTFVSRRDKDFFKDAVQSALGFLDSGKKDLYKDLLKHEGVLEEGEPPVDIFQWSAGALIAHYLRSEDDYRFSLFTHIYPRLHPKRHAAAQQHETEIENIWTDYTNLTNLEKASVLLKVIDPETPWKVEGNAKVLLNQIQARAQAMTQDAYFKEIFKPVIKKI